MIAEIAEGGKKWVAIGKDPKYGSQMYWRIRRVKSSLITKALKQFTLFAGEIAVNGKSESVRSKRAVFSDEILNHIEDPAERQAAENSISMLLSANELELEKLHQLTTGIVCAGVVGCYLPKEPIEPAILEEIRKELGQEISEQRARIHLLEAGLEYEPIQFVAREEEEDLGKSMVFAGNLDASILNQLANEIRTFSQGGPELSGTFRGRS